MISLADASGRFEHIRSEHFATKIAFVQRLTQDRFVDFLQFRQRKLGRQ